MEPNTELREKAREFLIKRGLTFGGGLIVDDMAAFAASIQEEAKQQIEELKRLVNVADNAFHMQDAVDIPGRGATLNCLQIAKAWRKLEERAESAEKQLAEARAQAFREAADAIPALGEMPKHVHPGFCPICDKFYARKAALEECAAAIHNRFCGENGEPCQVCRLKAEREEKK